MAFDFAWKSYSSKPVREKVVKRDKDGNIKYNKDGTVQYGTHINAGALALNIAGNGMMMGYGLLNLLPEKPDAENTNNAIAKDVKSKADDAMMQSGMLPLMAVGLADKGLDKLGWGATATNAQELGTLSNIGNTAIASTPIIGSVAGKLFGTSTALKYKSDLLEGSKMFSWQSDADGLFGARGVVFGGNKAKKLVNDENTKLKLADSILHDAKLDFSNDIAMVSKGINMGLNGGWNTVTNFGVNVAKQGTVLQFTKRTLSKHKIKKLQDGGKVQLGRTLDELVDYVEQQNPPFWKRMSGLDRNYIANDDGSVSSLRMTYSEKKGEPYVDVYPEVQYDLNGNLKYYFDPKEAYAMAKLQNDIVRMSREEAKRFTEGYKDSTKLKSYYRNYHPTLVKLPKEAWDWEYKTLNGSIPENEEIIEEFKEGGKVNVIPDGALHKNKHHLEEVDEKFEDVTTKGIPVIVESEDGEVIQLAEVEREEIIFRLEVTKKLEELSKKHTDEAAIEAGKLLVKEILYNTEDNTGKMI